MTNAAGIFYVVATPIGNLGDMSERAQTTLRDVAMIYAEDTRLSERLLRRFDIRNPVRALHEHNEQACIAKVIAQVEAGTDVAMICDAGTPLISDPGYRVVAALRDRNLPVVPVPGPCALVCALSVAGLPTNRFCFEGFLASKGGARRKQLHALQNESRTVVFYEAPHRIVATLADCVTVFGDERQAVVARELTKAYESVIRDSLGNLLARWRDGVEPAKGEFVVLIDGAPVVSESDLDAERVLRILLEELPLKQAASLAAQITGVGKNCLYTMGTKLRSAGGDDSGR